MKLWLALSSSAWIRLLSSTSIFLWRIKDSPAILEDHFISFYFVSPSSCITTLTYAAQHCLLLISNHIRCSEYFSNELIFVWLPLAVIILICQPLPCFTYANFCDSSYHHNCWLNVRSLYSASTRYQYLQSLQCQWLIQKVNPISVLHCCELPYPMPGHTHSVSLFLTAPLIPFSSAGRNAEGRHRLVEIR